MNKNSSPSTAIVTAHRRIEQTLATLLRISECSPPPDEICVHVDENQSDCANAIQDRFPQVRLIVSSTSVGPGGGRNKLLAAAKHEIVASFDDDSYPIDGDYFARIQAVMQEFPEASILSAAVYHQDETIGADERRAVWAADFGGGACVYRRSEFLRTTGYVPLRTAYGMEEVDLALRMHADGARILRTPWLRVFHATDLKRHAAPHITAASVTNLALLAYLRYSPTSWLYGVGQCLNRIQWLVRNRRYRGILRGLWEIPRTLHAYHPYRKPVSGLALRSYLKLRRNPCPVERHAFWEQYSR